MNVDTMATLFAPAHRDRDRCGDRDRRCGGQARALIDEGRRVGDPRPVGAVARLPRGSSPRPSAASTSPRCTHFVPCKLCWYQRIDRPLCDPADRGMEARCLGRQVRRAARGIGAAISIYHYQLERFPAGRRSRGADAPCTVVWIWKFHFVSIPLMALSGFALIVALVLVARSFARLDTDDDGATLAEHSARPSRRDSALADEPKAMSMAARSVFDIARTPSLPVLRVAPPTSGRRSAQLLRDVASPMPRTIPEGDPR